MIRQSGKTEVSGVLRGLVGRADVVASGDAEHLAVHQEEHGHGDRHPAGDFLQFAAAHGMRQQAIRQPYQRAPRFATENRVSAPTDARSLSADQAAGRRGDWK